MTITPESLHTRLLELTEKEIYQALKPLHYTPEDLQKELQKYVPNGRGEMHNPVAFETKGVREAEETTWKAMALALQKKHAIYYVYQEPEFGFQSAIFLADPKTRSVQFVKETSNPQPERYPGQFYEVHSTFAKHIEALGLRYNPTPVPRS